MKCLIRRVLRRSSAGQVHQDAVYETEALTLGRAAGQSVFLPDMQVALQHAVIKQEGKDRFSLQAFGGNQMWVNRRILQAATLKIGDKIGIGRATILVIDPPNGYDLALEIQPMAEDGSGRASTGAGTLTLKAAGASARPWAWLFFLLVLGLGLGVPLFIGYNAMQTDARLDARSQGTSTESDAMVANLETPTNLPGTELWSPGLLSTVHRFMGRDCTRCHTAPFQPVQDGACLHCHVNLAGHADSEIALAFVDLKRAHCSSCHQEHMGEAALVSPDDRTCTACHGDPHQRMPGSSLPAVHDFANDHPQFRVGLLGLDVNWHPSMHLVSMDDPHLARMPGLKFSHAVHLAPAGIKRSDGTLETLNCSSCHVADPGKVGFLALSFKQQCQRCHELNFEPGDPTTQLPHGNVAAAWSFLQGYYARLALRGGVGDASAPAAVAGYRLPNQELSSGQRQAALTWADNKAAAVGKEVFSYRLCVTCHQVRAVVGSTPPWQLAPVAQQQHWFLSAAFSHAPHTTMSCDSCHAARHSTSNTEVLMPKIAKCRECHAASVASGTPVSSDCVNCHAFHKAVRHTMAGSLVPADFLVQPLVQRAH